MHSVVQLLSLSVDFHEGYDLFIPMSLSFSLVRKSDLMSSLLEFGRKIRLNPLGPRPATALLLQNPL